MPSASRLLAMIFKCGTVAQQVIGQLRAGLDQVLAVIQDEQQAFGRADSSVTRSSRDAPGFSRRPKAAATVCSTSAGSASGASSTSQTPSAKAGSSSAGQLQRQAGLAGAAGAGQREQVGSSRADPSFEPARPRARQSC